MANAIIQRFQAGFRLIQGESLNKMVDSLNNINGQGTPNVGSFSTLTTKAGSGTGAPLVGGTLSVNITPTASGTATVTQTLMTYTLPANSLNANGTGVVVYAWGANGANGDSKNVLLNIGGKSIATGASTASGTLWTLKGRAFRTASGAQTLVFEGVTGATTLTQVQTTDTSVDTGTITIAVTTVTSGTASDVVQAGMTVDYVA